MTTPVAVPVVPVDSAPTRAGHRSERAPDRLMRRVLGVEEPVQQLGAGASQGAHRAFRVSVLISAVRCLITYVLVPILVPVLSLSGWVAAPIGMALCVLAVVNGVVSVRRFWRIDHPKRWMYTAFIGVVFIILAIALVSDLARMGVMA